MLSSAVRIRSIIRLATFEKDEVYNQADAAGFIKLHGLRLQARQPFLNKIKG